MSAVYDPSKRAKADIVDGDRSKKQLEGDVRLLYDLLERAKKERKCYGAVVKGLERSVAASEERRAKVHTKYAVVRVHTIIISNASRCTVFCFVRFVCFSFVRERRVLRCR